MGELIDLSKFQSTYRPADKKTISESEAAVYLYNGWVKLFKYEPKPEQLAIIWSQTCLETGRFTIGFMNYNFGNIKMKYDVNAGKFKEDHLFTMFATGENLTVNGKNKYVWFEPPHYQCAFKAYETAEDGAVDYLLFLSTRDRYVDAWKQVILGNVTKYSHELKQHGYYTANEITYTAGLERLFKEFMRKKDSLLAGLPDSGGQVTIPDIQLSENHIEDETPVPISLRADEVLSVTSSSIPVKREELVKTLPDGDTMRSPCENKKPTIVTVVEPQRQSALIRKSINYASVIVMGFSAIAWLMYFLGL